MTIKDISHQKDTANRVRGIGNPAPMPDPDQRILEKKADERTHGRLVVDAEKH